MATADRPDVLIVSPDVGGHHGEHLRWIVGALAAHGAGRVVVAGHPALLKAEADALRGVETRPLTSPARASGVGSRWTSGRATGRMLRAVVEAVRPRRAYISYLDAAQLALALDLRFPFDVTLAGLMFRATVHEPPTSPRDAVRRIQEGVVLRLAARNRHLGPVFTLDPEAVGPLRRLGLDARFLPDPARFPRAQRSKAEVRATLGIDSDRRLALLFGSLEDRKGIFETLDAVGRLAPEPARRLSLVFAGRTYDEVRPRLEAALKTAQRSGVQVVFDERFVPDDELDDLVLAADVVLAPYRGHVGSSGVVARAAAAGTPLLATDERMVGREVRRHRLGQTVDPADAAGFADAFARVAEDPAVGFDPASAAAYAADHTVEQFGRRIFDALFPDGLPDP